ncbi:MAG: HD domain-containing protein [Planctomycetaceae bacterium]|nr:HD domain-containing protein [Planctomycetaceae bacterium]
MPAEVLAVPARPTTTPLPVAVIDIGTSSVRMAVAEIDGDGRVKILATLSRPATLGKDAFTRGIIEKGTIEDCVRVLKGYRHVLAEHNIDRPEQIRCVATSAVREAQNRLAFIDRIYTATGITVQAIDEGEVNRLTYLGVLPLLKSSPELAGKRTVVVEVGGGSTELLVVQDADVLFSHSYRLGSLRLREQLETLRAPQASTRKIMELQIHRVIEQILQQIPAVTAQELIGLGGDLRFAAKQLIPDWTPEQTVRLPVTRLERLADALLSLNEDKLVHRYHVSFADAATLGPALLAYVQLCKAFQLPDLVVSHVNLRDGLLNELAARGVLSEDFVNQVVRSAVDLGKRFHCDEKHAAHVAKLCRILFQSLRDDHRLDPRYELLLSVAALLHEIGLYVSTGSYHKHTQYLINHSELFGLSRSDVQLVALAARYHRRSSPKPSHPLFAALDRDRRTAVAKMAALLRLADALDASRTQRLHELRLSREGGRLIIAVPQADDLSLEQLALKQSGTLFEETYGMPVLLRQLRT